jgi:hypothetical protein
VVAAVAAEGDEVIAAARLVSLQIARHEEMVLVWRLVELEICFWWCEHPLSHPSAKSAYGWGTRAVVGGPPAHYQIGI